MVVRGEGGGGGGGRALARAIKNKCLCNMNHGLPDPTRAYHGLPEAYQRPTRAYQTLPSSGAMDTCKP